MKIFKLIFAVTIIGALYGCKNDDPNNKGDVGTFPVPERTLKIVDIPAEGGEYTIDCSSYQSSIQLPDGTKINYDVICHDAYIIKVWPNEYPESEWLNANPADRRDWKEFFTIDESHTGPNPYDFTMDGQPLNNEIEMVTALHNDYLSITVVGDKKDQIVVRIQPTTDGPRYISLHYAPTIDNIIDLWLEKGVVCSSGEIAFRQEAPKAE